MRSIFALRPEGKTVIFVARTDRPRRDLSRESPECVIGPQHALYRKAKSVAARVLR